MKETYPHHMNLEVDGHSDVIRDIVLSHVHDIVQLIGETLQRPVLIG